MKRNDPAEPAASEALLQGDPRRGRVALLERRAAKLEESLLDANVQLAERDAEFMRLNAERDQELRRVSEQNAQIHVVMQQLERELAERNRQVLQLGERIREAEATIASMESTRVWQLGRHYWRTRDSARRLLRR